MQATTKSISLNVRGNLKQLETIKHWMDDSVIDIAYGGSKGCMTGSCKIRTNKGLVNISDVKIGDRVLTINETTKQNEYKLVLDTKQYSSGGSNQYHKIITFVMKSGEQFSLTPNHEIYENGNWTSSGEFAKRILERDNGWLSNLKYGASSFDSSLWQDKKHYFKTIFYKQGVFKNSLNCESAKDELSNSPISCYSFLREQGEQANCKSHQLYSFGQSSREFRMGYSERKRKPLQRTLSSVIQYSRRKSLELKTKRGESKRNTFQVQKESLYKRNVSSGVWGKSVNDKRRDIATQLEAHNIAEIRYELTNEDVYDLCVDSNNNYCVTSENLIVHNSGKSFLGCSLICGDALMYPETHYFIARQSLTDLRKYTIPSIQEVLTLWGITDDYWKYNGQDNYVKFHNGSKIFFLDAKFQPSDPNYMRFGSMQMTRGWIEESGEFDLECKNNLQASIGRWKNKDYNLAPKLLQTCNPSKNYLYKDYYKANQDGTIEPFRRFVQALPSDNKTLPKDYIENLKKTLSYNEVQRLVYGNWEFDDNPLALMDYTDILGMFTNEFVKPTQERYMSCDISYTGSDKFVITVWHGMVVVKIIAIDKIDDTMVSKKINELRIENRVPMKHVIFDADGLQTFTRNSQQTGLLSGAVAFHNNAKPVKVSGKMENFKNLKAQCYWAFSNACKDSNIFIQEAKYRKQVIEELEQINRKPNQDDGKIALESKKDIKDRLGRSPDFADSLAMRMFFELKGKPKLRIVW